MIHFHFAPVVHLVKLEFEIIKLVIFTGGGHLYFKVDIILVPLFYCLITFGLRLRAQPPNFLFNNVLNSSLLYIISMQKVNIISFCSLA